MKRGRPALETPNVKLQTRVPEPMFRDLQEMGAPSAVASKILRAWDRARGSCTYCKSANLVILGGADPVVQCLDCGNDQEVEPSK